MHVLMNLFSSSGFSWWKDLGTACCVWCCLDTLVTEQMKAGQRWPVVHLCDLAGYLGRPFSSLLRLLF